MAGIINSSQSSGIAIPDITQQLKDKGRNFVDYNGEQVVGMDDYTMQNLESGGRNMGMTAMEYDKFLNPTTYGARWDIPASEMQPRPTNGGAQSTLSSNTSGTANLYGMSGASGASAAPNAAGHAAGTGYTAAQQAPAVSSDITKREIDPATETTEGRVQGIINSNSPLMQQAQAKAMQAANDRGLGNSSLAVGAAQNAVLGAATPIANADAGIYGNAATLNTTTQNQFAAQKDATQNQINANNTGSTNTASAFSADSRNKASLQNSSLDTQISLSNADNATKKLLQTIQSNTQLGVAQLSKETQMALGQLDTDTKTQLATLDAQNRQLLQTNTSAGNLFNQTITNLTNIANSNTMDAAAKQAATDNQLTLLQQGMTAIGATAGTKPGDISSLNLGQYFTALPSQTAAAQPAELTAPERSPGFTGEGSDGGGE